MTVCRNRHAIRASLVNHSSGVGGSEASLIALVSAMPTNRCIYEVVLPSDGVTQKRLRQDHHRTSVVRMEGWRWWIERPAEVVKFVITLPLQGASVMRWLSFFRRTRPDLVHFNINRLVEPVIAARLLRIPSVMHFRDIPSRIDLRFVLGMRAFYVLMRMTDRWIANSAATFEDIRSQAPGRVRLIPNGIDLAEFDRKAAESDPRRTDETRPYVVAMVALLVRWKNHDGFLRMAKAILERRQDVTFLVAGSGSEEMTAHLRATARALGIEERVTFPGHVDNVPALMTQVDVLVHTTEREPFGRVFLEAMAARRPVVAFNNGGAAEIVVDGETGCLVSPGSVPAMADAVCALLDDAGLRRGMGTAGRRRVEAHYTIEAHAAAVLNVYDEVLGRTTALTV